MFVVVVTEFTKRLFNKKGKIKTDYIVFFYALILSTLKTLVGIEASSVFFPPRKKARPP